MFVTTIILGTFQVWKHFCVKCPVSKWNDKLKHESTNITDVGWELHTLLSILQTLLASTIQVLSYYIILREEFFSSIILILLLIYI